MRVRLPPPAPMKTLKEDLLKNKNITDKASKIEKLLNKKCKDT